MHPGSHYALIIEICVFQKHCNENYDWNINWNSTGFNFFYLFNHSKQKTTTANKNVSAGL